jgi:hypothetical protein
VRARNTRVRPERPLSPPPFPLLHSAHRRSSAFSSSSAELDAAPSTMTMCLPAQQQGGGGTRPEGGRVGTPTFPCPSHPPHPPPADEGKKRRDAPESKGPRLATALLLPRMETARTSCPCRPASSAGPDTPRVPVCELRSGPATLHRPVDSDDAAVCALRVQLRPRVVPVGTGCEVECAGGSGCRRRKLHENLSSCDRKMGVRGGMRANKYIELDAVQPAHNQRRDPDPRTPDSFPPPVPFHGN